MIHLDLWSHVINFVHSKKLYAQFAHHHFFIINSMGQTATLWLANQLNAHPKIACVHGKSYTAHAADTKDEPKHIPEDKFNRMSLESYLYTLASNTSKSFVGSVHAYTYNRFKFLLERANPILRSRISFLNMTRHPVTRIFSAVHCWGYGKGYTHSDMEKSWIPNDFKARCSDIIGYLSGRHTVDLESVDSMIFVVGLLQARDINRNNRIALDDKCHFLRFEEIAGNANGLQDIVHRISNGKITCDETFIRECVNSEAVNVHYGKKRMEPEAQFADWEPWQQDGLRYIASNENFIINYKRLGYDLSWLAN